jgi:hypothetical protein
MNESRKTAALRLAVVIAVMAGAVPARAEDLIVDGTAVTLTGERTFDAVRIVNGGALYGGFYDGTAGSGILKVHAKSILVDPSSSIIAVGRGFRGVAYGNGEGPGGGQGGWAAADGGAGGGHGGRGGRGACDYRPGCYDANGGEAYGLAEDRAVELGSAGGAAGAADGDFGGEGANGGGAIWLQADVIDVQGVVDAGAADAYLFVNDAAGGGAGGTILLAGTKVSVTGVLRANGGAGGGALCGASPCTLDDGGGGGAGGRIKIFYGTLAAPGNLSVAGGAGSLYGEAGESGTVFQKQVVIPVTIDVEPEIAPNVFEFGLNGNVPVAILSTPDFDATSIDPLSVALANAPVALKDGAPRAEPEDVNGDGLLDLVVHVDAEQLGLPFDAVEAVLVGATVAGVPVRGVDAIQFVQ